MAERAVWAFMENSNDFKVLRKGERPQGRATPGARIGRLGQVAGDLRRGFVASLTLGDPRGDTVGEPGGYLRRHGEGVALHRHELVETATAGTGGGHVNAARLLTRFGAVEAQVNVPLEAEPGRDTGGGFVIEGVTRDAALRHEFANVGIIAERDTLARGGQSVGTAHLEHLSTRHEA